MRDTEGRTPIEIIEIDQDFCALVYGESDCSALLSVDQNKCFNTLGTCGAPNDYTPSVYTLKFCGDQSEIPSDDIYYPFLKNVRVKPAEINPVGANKSVSSLGKRAVLTATFTDHPSTDRYIDPYQSERIIGTAQFNGEGYEPFERSTFWRKWKARNTYYLYRPLRYISGYMENGIVVDSVTQYFVITKISGTDEQGNITIEAKDILTLAQRDKAQAPRASSGKLDGNIGAGAGSATLTPAGIGDAEYPASGYVRINGEVIEFTRAGDTLTLVTRGDWNTTAAAHDAGDSIQLCLHFNAQLAYQILYTLLNEYAEIDASYLDTAQWIEESVTNGYLPLGYSALLTEPVEVEDLLSEITEQMYFYTWFDSRENKVLIRAVRPIASEPVTNITFDGHIVKGSININDQPDQLITRVVINYGSVNPTIELDDITNYRVTDVFTNLTNEGSDRYRISQTKTINSRWLGSGDGAAAEALGEKILARYSVPPLKIGFDLDAKDRDLWLGDFIKINSPFVVDSVGNNLDINAQVLRAEEKDAGSTFTYSAQEFSYELPVDPNYKELRRSGAGPDNNADINLRDWYDDVYPATPPTALDTIYVIIDENVIVNSTSTAAPAFEILSTDFPGGCTIIMRIASTAYIVGKGGEGGDGKNANGQNGSPGGVALYTRFPITIENNGIIGGGGGGGGGGAGESINTARIPGGGGGGGAGYGEKGVKGNYVDDSHLYFSIYDKLAKNGKAGGINYGSGGRNTTCTYLLDDPLSGYQDSGFGGNGGALGENGLDGGDHRTKKTTAADWITRHTGGSGGIAGDAIDGVSYITWTTKGDVRGDEIN